MADFTLKDEFYNPTYYNKLSKVLKEVKKDFDETVFLSKVMDKNWKDRELKARVKHTAESVHLTLKLSYKETIEVLKKAADKLGNGFPNMWFPTYVETYGLEDYDTSIDALKHFTVYSSSEFAVRPFIVKYPKKMIAQLLEWAKDENYHVRRLASEGCRPRLPWGMALKAFKKDPSPILPILELLKADKEDYVYRSVANNLNDISKDNPKVVLDICTRWQKDNHTSTNWAIKHACRGLLKQGNTSALLLFGFSDPKNVKLKSLKMTPSSIKLGADGYFDFELILDKPKNTKLRIEYAIDFVKKSGKTSRKIFKITENTYNDSSIKFKRKQRFQDFTTRKHYAGKHTLAILVNGVELGNTTFDLIPKK